MSVTITGTHNSGYTLSSLAQNPATLATGGFLTSPGTTFFSSPVLYGTNIAAWTFSNYGTISASHFDYAVQFTAGGAITNAGAIVGGRGISVFDGAATITNASSGIILGNYSAIRESYGLITNLGTIHASNGPAIGFDGGYGTVINYGLIASNGNERYSDNAVQLYGGGRISNAGTIAASGGDGAGVALYAGGTVVNTASGFISGLGTGVYFSGNNGQNVVSNSGTIVGSGPTGVGVVLAAAGTLTNYGTITGAGGIAIDLGTSISRIIIESGSSLGGVIANFTPGDTIDLPFLAPSPTGNVILHADNVLEVTESGISVEVALDPTQSFNGHNFAAVSDGHGGTLITEDTKIYQGKISISGSAVDPLGDTITASGSIFATVSVDFQSPSHVELLVTTTPQISVSETNFLGHTSVYTFGPTNIDLRGVPLPEQVTLTLGLNNGVFTVPFDTLIPELGTLGISPLLQGSFNVPETTIAVTGTGSASVPLHIDVAGVEVSSTFAATASVSGLLSMPGVALPAIDFDGNGTSDVLLHSVSAGSFVDWTMNGSAIASADSLTFGGTPIALDSSWSVVGTGDFNGDGKADILLRNPTTDGFVDFTMNGPTITAADNVTFGGATVGLDSSWSVLGTGDFNGDGQTDVLLHNTDGSFADFTMDSSVIGSADSVTFDGTPISLDASWAVVGTDDFNGDGKADILLRNLTTNGFVVFTMNGATITAADNVTFGGTPVGLESSWTVLGTGDFNGDGKADILLHNTDGAFTDFTMNGSAITAADNLTFQGSVVKLDSSWTFDDIGDFNGDGKADILYRNINGSFTDFTMNGSTITAAQNLTFQGNLVLLDTTWQT